jgi:histidyl-tRNA synthetase
VTVDFSVMRSFGYYTGPVSRLIAGLGVPLGGGGRYDRVLAALTRLRRQRFALGLGEIDRAR